MNITFFMSAYNSIADIQRNPAYSGGENILINLLRRWQDILNIEIFTWNGGEYFLKSHFGIDKIKYHNVIELKRKWKYPVLFIVRAVKAASWALRNKNNKADFIFSPSDFIPDSIPAFILKLKNPEMIWIASCYLIFPNPFSTINPYKGKRWIIGLLQFFAQLPVKYIIKWFADIVFVTSEPDKHFFVTKKRKLNKVVVVRGGVNLKDSQKINQQQKKYDCVFMGRFHVQKGVIELIKIWKLVVEKLPHCKLVILGQGDVALTERGIKNEIFSLIKRYHLYNNIEFLGFLDGDEKIKVFNSSRVVLHPAIFDSGGMAAAEAMACGLPGVSFDLEALKTYYPKGMLKTKCFDLQEFANNIIELLTNKELYNILSKEALDLIRKEWDWNVRATKIYDAILSSIKEKSE